MTSRYAQLSRAQLAVLVPELLLCGQLIDRSGMAWCIAEFGREAMADIAIDEWAAASPIYTRRMQRALNYQGDDVVTIFKGLQLDIGAPPQFMDFRYTVQDRWHGEFRLDHCGALMDVEPMGERYVRSMCHDIEDPTFDATAVATNPRAQVRPIHRPPRTPPDRHPHCAWTVIIDEVYPAVSETAGCRALQDSRAATLELAPIDPADVGRCDYSGPLLSDVDFGAFSHSALVRVADEVVLQMHLLAMGFAQAVRSRATSGEQAGDILGRSLVGIAGITAERLHRALGLDALRVLELHPMLNPAAYVEASVSADVLSVHHSPGHEDGGWPALVGPHAPRPLQAAVRAVDPTLDVELEGTPTDWTLRVVRTDGRPPKEFDEVAVTRVSTGAAFQFGERRSLPVVAISGG